MTALLVSFNVKMQPASVKANWVNRICQITLAGLLADLARLLCDGKYQIISCKYLLGLEFKRIYRLKRSLVCFLILLLNCFKVLNGTGTCQNKICIIYFLASGNYNI